MPWMVRARSQAQCAVLCALPQHVSLQVGVGSHEVDTHENEFHSARGNDSGGECGIANLKRFPQFASSSEMWCVITNLSELEAASDLALRYSFSYGLVHIVVLSSEHPQAAQVEFFMKDMAALQRSVTPWVIVHLHRRVAPGYPFTGCGAVLTPLALCAGRPSRRVRETGWM